MHSHGSRENAVIMAQKNSRLLNGIGFGTWAWGNRLIWGYSQRDDERIEATFRQAVASGLNLIDTADSYGTGNLNGRSETLLGHFISRLPANRRSELMIATKLAPFPWRLGRRGFDRAFHASKERLKGHLNRVQLHWSTARYAPWQEMALLDGLVDLVHQGLVNELGVSNVGPKGLALMHEHVVKRGVSLRSVQIQFSLLAPASPFLQTFLEFCFKQKIEVLAYSPLAFGILSKPPQFKYIGGTKLRRQVFRSLLDASSSLRQTIHEIAKARDVSMAQVALNWCRGHGTTPIPGLSSPEQATDVSLALNWNLTLEEMQVLDKERDSCSKRMPSNPFQSA